MMQRALSAARICQRCSARITNTTYLHKQLSVANITGGHQFAYGDVTRLNRSFTGKFSFQPLRYLIVKRCLLVCLIHFIDLSRKQVLLSMEQTVAQTCFGNNACVEYKNDMLILFYFV